jgi:hypothetical protein
MGGSGGGGLRSTRSAEELRAAVQQDLASAQLDGEVNALLSEKLAAINHRNVGLVSKRLDEVETCLADRLVDVDRLLFGGSVAKHTYVDGLSDIDALLVINADTIEGQTPTALREAIVLALERGIDQSAVVGIRAGFAVTVTYRDGAEIQLLPAIERDGQIAISDKAGTGWSFIRPKAFEERLTAANRGQGGRVVPVIKLAKAVVDQSLGKADRPGGYHLESLAIDAFQRYSGPRDSRSMLIHFFEHAAVRIKSPIADITGQSSRIDEVFGPANSPARQHVSAALERVANRMCSAASVGDWNDLFGQ